MDLDGGKKRKKLNIYNLTLNRTWPLYPNIMICFILYFIFILDI